MASQSVLKIHGHGYWGMEEYISALSKIAEKEKLLQLIDQEIENNLPSDCDDVDEHDGPQEDSSFQLVSNYGLNSMIIKRKFDGEIIKAVVNVRYVTRWECKGENDVCPVTGYHREYEDLYDEFILLDVKMVITIAKAEGPIFEFDCRIFHDLMKVAKMRVINSGDCDSEYVYRGDLDSASRDSLQKALCGYLEVRGITPEDTIDLIHEYMMTKEGYTVLWLKNVKAFIVK